MKLEKEPEAPLQFSLAAESDFEEVMAMSEGIYGGLDYLPSRYHAWLREPQRTVVLAKRAGAVVRPDPRASHIRPILHSNVPPQSQPQLHARLGVGLSQYTQLPPPPAPVPSGWELGCDPL